MSFPTIPKPLPELTRKLEESVVLFLTSKKLNDVAEVLEVNPGHLKYWLYDNPGHSGYATFKIAKKSHGHRSISAPPSQIKILQLKFKTILDYIYKPKNCVYGFVADKCIVDGAAKHKKRAKWILNIDIEDFYPSINFGRVRGLFIAMGIGAKAASIWAHLVTYEGKLPQGAPTSPVISNMIAKQLDNKLLQLTRNFHLTYTRYADDLTFSTTKNTFPKQLAIYSGTPLSPENVELQPHLVNALHDSGFKINNKKTRLQSRYVRQEVTGLTVNEFVNVHRKSIRQIRAMLHAVKKYGYEKAGAEYIKKYAPSGRISADVLTNGKFDVGEYFRSVIYGKLAFIRMVRGKTDKCYVNFCLKMAEIDPDPPNQILEIKKMYEKFDVFICHASEDKESVAKPLYDALEAEGVHAFIDEKYIKWGDSITEIINKAISRARLFAVVLSVNSVDKAWPNKELNSALAREISGKRTKVLPIVVGTESEVGKIREKLSLLEDKSYRRWKNDAKDMAIEIKDILRNSCCNP